MGHIMKTMDEILETIRAHKEEIMRRFSVRSIALFGSHARDAATAESDIDLLVEFDDLTFDHYMDLKFFFEDVLGAPVDIVLADTLKPRLKPRIYREMIHA